MECPYEFMNVALMGNNSGYGGGSYLDISYNNCTIITNLGNGTSIDILMEDSDFVTAKKELKRERKENNAFCVLY